MVFACQHGKMYVVTIGQSANLLGGDYEPAEHPSMRAIAGSTIVSKRLLNTEPGGRKHSRIIDNVFE